MVSLCAMPLPGGGHLLQLHRQDAAVQRIADQLGLSAQAELLHEMDAMRLHRAGADAQGGPYLRRWPPLGGQMQHLALTRRQRLIQILHPWRGSVTLYRDETLSHGRAECGTPGSDITDFRCECADIILFEE